MLARVWAIALNTFREAARDRVPLAIFGAGLAVGLTSMLVSAMSLGRDRSEVVAIVTSASVSLFALVGAIVLGATLLYKDLERKTIFPILARPIHRYELVIGKHVGLVAMVATFTTIGGAQALTLTALAREDVGLGRALAPWLVVGILGGAQLIRARDRSMPFLVLGPTLFVLEAAAVGPMGPFRAIVLAAVALAILEAAIVAAISMVFGAFSTPFLTALFTIGVVLIGRNADLLAKLPERTFGHTVVAMGRALSHVVPNLQLYVPPRVVVSGETGTSAISYLASAGGYGVLYTAILLAVSAFIFGRRDFA
jgi:Cu-processing system permease protein